MLPLNPASLDNNISNTKFANINKKTPANRTLKNKNFLNNSIDTKTINDYDKLDNSAIANPAIANPAIANPAIANPDIANPNSSDTTNKLTNINSLIEKIYNQKNEKINNNIFNPANHSTSNQVNPVNPVNPSTDTNIRSDSETTNLINNNLNEDMMINNNEYQKLNNTNNNYSDNYYNSFVPYYTKLSNTNENVNNNVELLNKLNYVIHLLEEQQNQKTNYITEELILYTFLGIFIIFVLDNFAKSTKYIR